METFIFYYNNLILLTQIQEQGQKRAMARLAEIKKTGAALVAPNSNLARHASTKAKKERKQERKKGKKDSDCVIM